MARPPRLLMFVLAAAVAWAAACETVPAGPSLTAVTLTGLSKEPTAGGGDPAVCCCHATGNVANNNSVPVHVTITIAALDAEGVQLGRVPAFVRDLQPGSTRAVDAAGFVFPCASIARLDYELNVSSLALSIR